MLLTNMGMYAKYNIETNATQTKTELIKKTPTVTTKPATTAKTPAEISTKKQEEKSSIETEKAQRVTEQKEQANQQAASVERIKELIEEVDLVSNDVKSIRTQLLIAEIVAGLAIVLALCAVVILINEKKKFRDKLIRELNDCWEGGRMDNFARRVAEKAKSASSSSSSSIAYQPAKINQGELKSMIDDYLTTKLEQEEKQQEIKLEEQRIFQQNQPKKLFADSIVENHFNKISENADDDTVFELYLKKETDLKAEFTIYENAKRRVLKNADFIDGCDKQKINSNPIDLQIEKGTAILQDGKWQISQKAKVKFV